MILHHDYSSLVYDNHMSYVHDMDDVFMPEYLLCMEHHGHMKSKPQHWNQVSLPLAFRLLIVFIYIYLYNIYIHAQLPYYLNKHPKWSQRCDFMP